MYKIVEVGKNDAWYPDRKKIVGLVGEFRQARNKGKYKAGEFVPDSKNFPYDLLTVSDSFYFYSVKVTKI